MVDLTLCRKTMEKKLEFYNFEVMAALAECLIDLTGFQHILNFDPEEVGSLIDVTVISKNHGFIWISRKS